MEQGTYTVLVSKIYYSFRLFNVSSLSSYALSIHFCCNGDLPVSKLSVIYVCDVLGKLSSVLNIGTIQSRLITFGTSDQSISCPTDELKLILSATYLQRDERGTKYQIKLVLFLNEP